jgi:hypothetical protein
VKSLSAIVHYDDPGATWTGVRVPSIVPVLLDCDPGDVIGRARLTEIPPEHGLNYAIRADITLFEEIFNLPDPPDTFAAVMGAREPWFDDGTWYIRDGEVSNVSILTPEAADYLFDQDADNPLRKI